MIFMKCNRCDNPAILEAQVCSVHWSRYSDPQDWEEFNRGKNLSLTQSKEMNNYPLD